MSHAIVARVWSIVDLIAPMPHHAPEVVVAALFAAELEAELNCSLPLPPTVLCAAFGWQMVAAERTGDDPQSIAYSGDDNALALAVAQRLVTLAGFSAMDAPLVDAAARRFCGPFFLANRSADSSGLEASPYPLRKCAELLGRDRIDAA